MTNKEAIEILKPLTEYRVGKHGIATLPIVSAPLQVEALDLAIKALEFVEKYYPITFAEYLKGEEE